MAAIDLKLVLLGHKNVGKTSIFNRYVYDEFGRTSMTIGAYFGMKSLTVNDRMVNLAIWDTAGEEKFDSLTSFYCRGAACAIVTYDITAYDTFQNVQRWVDKVKNEADSNCVFVLVGNKVDACEANPALRRVDIGEARRYATSVGATVLEVSAKSGVNVTEAFAAVVAACFEKAAKNGNELGGRAGEAARGTARRANLKAPEQPKKEGCC